MTITNRNLEVGTRLVGRYKGKTTVCLVEAGEEGKVVFRVDGNDRTFNSLSSAATAITNGPINGWKFWQIEGDEPATSEKPAKPAKASKPAAKKSTTTKEGKSTKRTPRKSTYKVIHVDKNQSDLTEGEVRWLCDACIKPFILPAGETPTECPNGHRNDDPELNTGAVATEAEAE